MSLGQGNRCRTTGKYEFNFVSLTLRDERNCVVLWPGHQIFTGTSVITLLAPQIPAIIYIAAIFINTGISITQLILPSLSLPWLVLARKAPWEKTEFVNMWKPKWNLADVSVVGFIRKKTSVCVCVCVCGGGGGGGVFYLFIKVLLLN